MCACFCEFCSFCIHIFQDLSTHVSLFSSFKWKGVCTKHRKPLNLLLISTTHKEKLYHNKFIQSTVFDCVHACQLHVASIEKIFAKQIRNAFLRISSQLSLYEKFSRLNSAHSSNLMQFPLTSQCDDIRCDAKQCKLLL